MGFPRFWSREWWIEREVNAAAVEALTRLRDSIPDPVPGQKDKPMNTVIQYAVRMVVIPFVLAFISAISSAGSDGFTKSDIINSVKVAAGAVIGVLIKRPKDAVEDAKK